MSNFNKVIITGNLVANPELKQIGDNNQVVKVRLASNRSYPTKSGESKTDTVFLDCEMWGKRAKVVSDYLKKGDPILFEGHLRQDTWETEGGEKRNKIYMSIEDFTFMGKGGSETKSEAASPSLDEVPF
jgi:single-strand DNA-binding protein